MADVFAIGKKVFANISGFAREILCDSGKTVQTELNEIYTWKNDVILNQSNTMAVPTGAKECLIQLYANNNTTRAHNVYNFSLDILKKYGKLSLELSVMGTYRCVFTFNSNYTQLTFTSSESWVSSIVAFR